MCVCRLSENPAVSVSVHLTYSTSLRRGHVLSVPLITQMSSGRIRVRSYLHKEMPAILQLQIVKKKSCKSLIFQGQSSVVLQESSQHNYNLVFSNILLNYIMGVHPCNTPYALLSFFFIIKLELQWVTWWSVCHMSGLGPCLSGPCSLPAPALYCMLSPLSVPCLS